MRATLAPIFVCALLGCGARTGVRQIADASLDGATADGGADAAAGDGGLDAAVGIHCGSSTCIPRTERCCVFGNSPVQQCVPANAPGPRCEFSASCDGAEDCANGEQCCSPSGAIAQTYCFKGACPAGRALCHQQGDCTSDERCCTSYEFGWIHQVCTPGTQCP